MNIPKGYDYSEKDTAGGIVCKMSKDGIEYSWIKNENPKLHERDIKDAIKFLNDK